MRRIRIEPSGETHSHDLKDYAKEVLRLEGIKGEVIDIEIIAVVKEE